MKGDDIAARLVALAVGVVKIVDSLNDTPAARHVAGQLLRSGTSPGANYRGGPRGGEPARLSPQAGDCAEGDPGDSVLVARRCGGEVDPESRVAGGPYGGRRVVQNPRNVKAHRQPKSHHRPEPHCGAHPITGFLSFVFRFLFSILSVHRATPMSLVGWQRCAGGSCGWSSATESTWSSRVKSWSCSCSWSYRRARARVTKREGANGDNVG